MHHHSVSPIVIPRSPVLRSRGSFSQSQANSATSSPTISQSTTQYILNSTAIPNPLSYTNGNPNGTYQGHHRSGSSSSAVSSPTVRSTMALASPILRPVPRLAVGMKRGSAGDMDGEKGLDGAGEAVGSLSLGRWSIMIFQKFTYYRRIMIMFCMISGWISLLGLYILYCSLGIYIIYII